MSEFNIEPLQILWGDFETIDTVAGLAQCLLHKWPATIGGQAYVTALMVCSAVLENGVDDRPEDARAAFVEAAHEAGLTISPDDDDLE